MSLEYAILGWLNLEPMTGYDLKALIDSSIQHFWQADQSQIYRTLTKIEELGWVTVDVVHQETRPPKKVYHITSQGRQALETWLATPLDATPQRLPWLIQVFFAAQISDEQILMVLEHQLMLVQTKLVRFQHVRAASQAQFAPDEDPRSVFYWMLTLDYGDNQSLALRDWLIKTIERIRQKSYQNDNQVEKK